MRPVRVLPGVFALALAFAPATDLSAQLQFGGSTSNFGSVSLAAGFTPDPHTVAVTSGGGLDVGSMSLGAGCVGFATQQPDYIVTLTSSSNRLRFFVEGDGDTGLIVGLPGKQFRCNDDTVGLDPMVDVQNAQAGQYNVWVSSYSSAQNLTSTLSVTELDLEPGDGMATGSSDLLDIGGDAANFGTVTLSPGFTPDPHTVSVTSGGGLDVAAMELGDECRGYATSTPDFILDYSQVGAMLRFYVEGEGDTSLIINAPDATWHCSDDAFGTTDPAVTFDSPMAGQYDVWVGSYFSGESITGTLKITELDANRPGG